MTPYPKVRSDLPAWLVENGFKVGAEIGVYEGEFTEILCLAGVERIYAIDPWAAYNIKEKYKDVDTVSQERQDFLYGHAHRTLDKYPNCTIIRKGSIEALADFEDESLDFVYIDADHSFAAVAADIMGWSRKVKIGGIVSGHDYTSLPIYGAQVRPVVDAAAETLGTQVVVIGSNSKADTKRRGDGYHSWLWIKV
jgi:hypothetical protein